MRPRSLYERIIAALVWVAAFCFACGVFLSVTLLFPSLPATKPVAIGLVTIERYSKLRDYLGAALFFVLVPPLTVWLRGLLARRVRRFETPAAVLALVPYLLAPFFYLTTGKVGWILLLPVALSYAGPLILNYGRTHRWLRELFRPGLRPYHVLLFTEALSWILFRYLVTGRRIAHIPTLFLEVVFVALFMALFWCAAIFIARLAQILFAREAEETFRRITTAALPLVALPFLAVMVVPTPMPRAITVATLLLIALLTAMKPIGAKRARTLAAFAIIPAIIYLFSYASTAQLSQWIDLFHRGESIGPASDYLRGKAPFRDVFALHGMLEDGQLDAWLMQLFGRSLDVAVARTVVIGGFLGVSIWFLGVAVFESIPLALLCVAMGAWTTAENDRTFFQVAAVALFWNALRRRSRASAVFSGIFAGIALFFSYEIGLYTIVGAIAVSIAIAIMARRVPWDGLAPLQAALFFLLGAAIGAAPFALYLASRGALGEFVNVSFFTIPRIIDAVWSLPFPDLVSTFRNNLTLHTLADFVLWEKFHLILSPLTIAVSAIYVIQRWLTRRIDTLDVALLVLTIFSLVTQRTAFGRASFRHQYFAAFLIGPMLVLLGLLAVRRLRALWREGGEGTRAFVVALVMMVVPVIVVLFWIPDLVNARIHDFIRYDARVLRTERDQRAEDVQWRITDVTRYIHEVTRPSDPIFDFSNQPAFYFFADRPNPTRFYQVPILSPREFQAETIQALERGKPKIVIRRSPEGFDWFDGVPNDLRAQAVSSYIDDCYSFWKSVRGVELWMRRADAKPRPVAEYLKRIRLPQRKELVGSAVARLVFPAVGSVHGAEGSYWQSDLTLHNPFRDPIAVTLRYVAGERHLDRRLTLAPRQTLRWANVARGFFGIEGVVGSLWIEHREGRAPVAVVKTSDVAHGGRATVETPLSKRDSATAGSDAAELTIVGIPASSAPGRRVNVGIVNIGIIPATFRITVRDRNGRAIGKPIESGIPEDEVWLVPALEQELGIALDEGATVRLTAIAGTGVGFATVVDTTGDNEFIAAIPAQQQ
ncbi:MAG TPA: hypothetical protein VGF48_05440 [Thermoanaerobaculia bacterium]